MNVEEGFQLKDLVGIVRRRLAVSVWVGLAVFLVAVVLVAWLPNKYVATATVLVEPQAISERLIEAGLEASDLNKRLNLMTMQILSRPRLSAIIDDLGLYERESESLTREQIIGLMREQITVAPVLPELSGERPGGRREEYEINTFTISFLADSPRVAANVANRLANDFIEKHISERVQLSGDTSEFIQTELERLTTRIREVEAEIASVKERNSGSLPEDMRTNQQMLERVLDQIRQSRGEMAVARSDEAFFRQQVLSADTGGDETSDPVRRLEAIEINLGAMRSRGLTDKHPDVIAAKQEMEELRAMISADAAPPADGAPASLNEAQQNAEAERLRAELRITMAQEELSQLETRADELQERLAATPRVAEQLAALEREYVYLSEKFREFSDKRLDAGVAAGVERRQKGEQFRVLESALPPLEPSSPNRLLILAMGVLLGGALGGGMGLLLEAVDTSFHGARQLQGALRIPVLATIPAIVLDADRAAARRRRLRVGLAAAAVVGFVLGSSAFGYWWVNLSGRADSAQTTQEAG